MCGPSGLRALGGPAPSDGGRSSKQLRRGSSNAGEEPHHVSGLTPQHCLLYPTQTWTDLCLDKVRVHGVFR